MLVLTLLAYFEKGLNMPQLLQAVRALSRLGKSAREDEYEGCWIPSLRDLGGQSRLSEKDLLDIDTFGYEFD